MNEMEALANKFNLQRQLDALSFSEWGKSERIEIWNLNSPLPTESSSARV